MPETGEKLIFMKLLISIFDKYVGLLLQYQYYAGFAIAVSLV